MASSAHWRAIRSLKAQSTHLIRSQTRLIALHRPHSHTHSPQLPHTHHLIQHRRHHSSSTWPSLTAHPNSKVQIYTSITHNPYLNLSLEHRLLQLSHPDSTVLFLYVNDPCVVIGRNQNPWLEVNLARLRSFIPLSSPSSQDSVSHHGQTTQPVQKGIPLVRRRSGGGAVFHDRGNVNYSVICPPAVFDRDRHAEMIVRALRELGVGEGVRVNERHDIVVTDPSCTPSSATTSTSTSSPQTYKISGSAYKLTRLRSLHHGTCLLESPHLAQMGALLRSPAEAYIKARGVESVRSKVRNIGGGKVGVKEFCEAVRDEFRGMYGHGDDVVEAELGDGEGEVGDEKLRMGVEELMSPEWTYGQTPQFTFSTHPSETDPRDRPELPSDLPQDLQATMTVRHGLIQEASLTIPSNAVAPNVDFLHGQTLHDIADWAQHLSHHNIPHANQTGRWLNSMFGISSTP